MLEKIDVCGRSNYFILCNRGNTDVSPSPYVLQTTIPHVNVSDICKNIC
jgi:hypothetical protein